MIILHLILHSAVHMYDFHIFITSSLSFHGFITNHFNDLLPVGLLAYTNHDRYLRGQGFEFRTSLNFFSGFLFATAKVAYVTAMIILHLILHHTVHTYDFHIFINSINY